MTVLRVGKRSRFIRARRAGEWETALEGFANSPALNKAASLVADRRAEFYRERKDSQL